MLVRPNAIHLKPFSGYLSTAEPDIIKRQEWQIVQSELNLDDSLPGFTPSGRHLADKREVGSSSLPRPFDLRDSGGGGFPPECDRNGPCGGLQRAFPKVVRIGPLVAHEHRLGPPLWGLRSHRHGVQGWQPRGSV